MPGGTFLGARGWRYAVRPIRDRGRFDELLADVPPAANELTR